MRSDGAAKTGAHEAIIKEISDQARHIRYGLISVKVHDGRIIQVEVTEKKRFDNLWTNEEGGGI